MELSWWVLSYGDLIWIHSTFSPVCVLTKKLVGKLYSTQANDQDGFLTLYPMDMCLNASGTSEDPDQPAHP